MKFSQIALVLLAMLESSVASPPQNPQGQGNNNGQSGSTTRSRGRQISYLPPPQGKNEFAIRSLSKDTSTQTKLELKFKADNVPSFDLRFFNRSDTSLDQFRMRVDVLRVIEYNDTIPIQSSTSQLRFNQVNPSFPAHWSSVVDGKSQETLSDGSTVTSIRTSLVFNGHPQFGNLNFTVKAYAADSDSTVAGVQLTPEGFKYSIIIQNWPAKYQNSKLAVMKAIWVKDNTVAFGDRNETVRIGAGGSAGRFMWATTALADGVSKSVMISPGFGLKHDNENTFAPDSAADDDNGGGQAPRLLAFTLPMAQTIDWDPQIAFESTYAGTGTTTAATTSDASRTASSYGALAAIGAAVMMLF